ncbi:MAG: glycogen/starch synthase [Desulfuromonadia bacterium]
MKPSILISASEAVPFAKEGGLADVVGALPKELLRQGHDVRLVMPLYGSIDRERFGLWRREGVLVVPMGVLGDQYCAVWEGRIPGSDVQVYFLEHDLYFGRKGGLYSHDNVGYADNGLRFVFLSRATLELPKMIRFRPDVIHLHDWHTAVAALFLNALYRDDQWVGSAASLLTIHNMQYQGEFHKSLMDVLGVGWEYFTWLGLERHDQVNLLKGGLYHATLLSTVSEGYAREIQTPEFGWGLEGVVRERAADLVGILNGVDYDEWNPETDPLIPATYTVEDRSGKRVCKMKLQERFSLPVDDRKPVFAMVSRLVKQKGIDILAEALPHILGLDLQLVLLGSGEPWSHFHFGEQAALNPSKFACSIGYDTHLAHLIEAGADFFLMPSLFEPCGMSQMYSMRYGTLPIVRATGGLVDSVENFDEQRLTGTGFVFRDHTASALYDTIGWALHTWYNRPEAMDALIRSAMNARFHWSESAERYGELYRRAIVRKRGNVA